MSGLPEGECSFSDGNEVANALVERCRAVIRLDSITPGATGDWLLEVDGKPVNVQISVFRGNIPA